ATACNASTPDVRALETVASERASASVARCEREIWFVLTAIVWHVEHQPHHAVDSLAPQFDHLAHMCVGTFTVCNHLHTVRAEFQVVDIDSCHCAFLLSSRDQRHGRAQRTD